MEKHDLQEIHGDTQIIIAPSYTFKIVDVLITNFHQPKSTLLLLVSAFYGEQWRKSYNYALENNFRFLSYGDSCLFFKK
jgi:S-adenosylmethionine:tRNA ribosyltransferase-isomerase